MRKQVGKISKTLLNEAGKTLGSTETETSQIKKLIREAIRINIETAASEQAKMKQSFSIRIGHKKSIKTSSNGPMRKNRLAL